MNTQPQGNRSTFVTVLAWASIAFSAFTVCLGVIQALMIFLAFETGGLGVVMEEVARSGELAELPWPAQWAFANMQWLMLLPLLIGWITLAVSIGLLRRKNWARIVFIIILVISSLATIAGTIFLWIGPSLVEFPSGDLYGSEVTTMMQTMSLIFTCLNLASVALHGWIAWRLTRAPIRREFGVDAALTPE